MHNAQVPVILIATNIMSILFNNYLQNHLPMEGHFELHANNNIQGKEVLHVSHLYFEQRVAML